MSLKLGGQSLLASNPGLRWLSNIHEVNHHETRDHYRIRRLLVRETSLETVPNAIQ